MHRFIFQQNIHHFECLLATETDKGTRDVLVGLLASARRELTCLEASTVGALAAPDVGVGRCAGETRRQLIARFQRRFSGTAKALLLLDPRPGLHIVDVSDAYAAATMVDRGAVCGVAMFEAFPDNPGDPAADGVTNLFKSLRIAATSGDAHAMPIQRYDVRDATGEFVKRFWRPVNTPVYDSDGHLVFLLHEVEDVTALVTGPG